MIRCPACGHELRTIGSSQFPPRVCDGCKGALVPLRKLLEHVQAPHLQKIAAITEETGRRGKRICPTCRRWMATDRLLNRTGAYDLDVCPPCGVVWFDAGELAQAPTTPEVIDQTEEALKKWDEVIRLMYENEYGHEPYRLDRADFIPSEFYWIRILDTLASDDPDARKEKPKVRGKLE